MTFVLMRAGGGIVQLRSALRRGRGLFQLFGQRDRPPPRAPVRQVPPLFSVRTDIFRSENDGRVPHDQHHSAV